MFKDIKFPILCVLGLSILLSFLYEFKIYQRYFGVGSIGLDGVIFDNKTTRREQVVVRVTVHENILSLLNISIGQHEFINEVPIFAKIDGKECHVHIIDPLQNYSPTAIGHAISHCVWGDFHGED